jgi:dihydrofolate reductase
MGTIVVFENVSLDGVTQDPTGDEGFSRSDWRAMLSASDRAAWETLILDDALGAQALLLGRRSYEFFAARYPERAGALAEQLNGLPKYVVSTTLMKADAWSNSTVLAGEVVPAVTKLKRTIDGEIRIYASSRLVHTLIEHDLVDELRLAIFPLTMGAGARALDRSATPKPLRLLDTRRVGDRLAYLTYQFRAETS